jgi:glycosyltransferase involved in cell wall biosynthesis
MKSIMNDSDVAHINNIFHLSMSPFMAADRAGVPVVLDIHDVWPICFKKDCLYRDTDVCREWDIVKCSRCLLASRFSGMEALLPFYLPMLWADRSLRRRIIRPDHVIVHSDYVRRKISCDMLPDAEVIPYCYLGRRANVKRRPGKSIRILFINRLIRQKGAGIIPGISENLRKAGIKHVIEVVGDGPMAAELRERSKGLSIRYHGAVYDWDRKDRMFREADVLIMPSQSEEPFGIVTLEAMAYGLPMVSTDRGGLGELVRSNGAGITCEPSADAFSGAISEMVSDRKSYDGFSANGRRNIKKYEKKRIFRRYEKMFERAAGISR